MALGCHRRVQRSPFVGRAAHGGGIDGAQQAWLVRRIEALEGIVRADQIGIALDRYPVPARSEHDGRTRVCPKVHELSRSSSRDEGDH